MTFESNIATPPLWTIIYTYASLRAYDLQLDASIAVAAQKLRDGAIQIDALVNNAGVYGVARGREGFALTLETNFFGPLRVTLGLLPLLRDGAVIGFEIQSLVFSDKALFRVPLEGVLSKGGWIGEIAMRTVASFLVKPLTDQLARAFRGR